jgi:hypothetical protein
MHRSGTSLVASVLRAAGMDIGRADVDPIAGPVAGQPRGHFEDRDVHRLHEAILAAAGHTCFTADEAAVERVPPAFEEQARAFVAARADRPFWGWKDPRTCLFLDLWERHLPRARHLFLYRHPVDVALSLWRRNTEAELREDAWLAFRAWELSNRRLLAFRDRHPERCFVAYAPMVAADLAGFLERLAARLDLPLRPLGTGDLSALYDPEELVPSCRPARPVWEVLVPEALALYDRLEGIADLSSAGEPTGTAPAEPGRRRSSLQASETLLYALLAVSRRDDIDLRRELARLRLEQAELRQRLAAAEGEARILREIEGSRSFALVRSWWRLRRRLGGQR